MLLTMVSSGSVTSFTASSALRPLASHEDVDHRHGNLRLLLARQGEEGDEAHRQGGEQEQRRERRLDEGARQAPGNAEAHGVTTVSPSRRPERISTEGVPLSSKRWPMMTGTSTSPCELHVVDAGAGGDGGGRHRDHRLHGDGDPHAGALADEEVTEVGDLDIGQHVAVVDLGIDLHHLAVAKRGILGKIGHAAAADDHVIAKLDVAGVALRQRQAEEIAAAGDAGDGFARHDDGTLGDGNC